MTSRTLAVVAAAAITLGQAGLASAENAKFKYLTAVYADANGGGIRLPEGVACDARGQFVVSDTGNDRLLRFTFADRKVGGGSEIKLEELTAPTKLQLTTKGELFAFDGKRRRIVRIGPDGAFKGSVSYEGVPPPATVVPKSFVLDASDNLYVLDVLGARVLVFDAAGKFQRAMPLPDEIGFASDVAVDVGGTVLVLDSIGKQVFAAPKDAATFTPLGKGLDDAFTSMPSAILVNKGTIIVVEGTGSSFVTIARDGTFLSKQLSTGRAEGSLMHPSQVCINDKDDVFVADRDNSRIQVFGLIR